MAKTIYNYNFVSTGDFQGTQTGPVAGTEGAVGGDLCEPGQIVKLSAGSDAWSQDPQIITDFLGNNLSIASLQSTAWSTSFKDEWLQAYMTHVGLESIISDSAYYNTILAKAESLNLFQQLSGPSIGWVTQNSTSGEVSIGLNAYENQFIKDFALTMTVGNSLRNAILNNHINNTIYISNCADITYQTFSDIVYAFDAYVFEQYDLSSLTMTPSLENGGGNIFGEVKLAGNGVLAHYIVKKNVNHDDPTLGLCSGDLGPFCIGDEIILIDTTIWTENFGTAGTGPWSWLGDYSQLNYDWYIADISDVCNTFKYIPISNILVPFRAIMFCKFEDFG